MSIEDTQNTNNDEIENNDSYEDIKKKSSNMSFREYPIANIDDIQSIGEHKFVCIVSKEKIPSELFEKKWIKSISISSSCRNVVLPEEIGNLSELQVLRLILNNISVFPQSIEKLSNLVVMEIFYCFMLEFPEILCQLKNLKVLKCMANNFTNLPVGIGKLKELTIVDFSYNKLTKFPEFFVNLPNLCELNLTGNKINSLPENIGNLTNLKILKVSFTNISKLPDSISSLKQLISLGCRENILTTFPEIILGMNKKLYCDLENNMIRNLPSQLILTLGHQKIELQNNRISKIPFGMQSLMRKNLFEVPNNLFEVPNNHVVISQIINECHPIHSTEPNHLSIILSILNDNDKYLTRLNPNDGSTSKLSESTIQILINCNESKIGYPRLHIQCCDVFQHIWNKIINHKQVDEILMELNEKIKSRCGCVLSYLDRILFVFEKYYKSNVDPTLVKYWIDDT